MIRTAFIGCLITLLISSCGWSQLRETIDEKAIELAEQYAMELVQRRANLPAKWAAQQERIRNDFIKIDQLKVSITKFGEFTAHHSAKKITLTKYTEDSHTEDPLSKEPPIDRRTDPFSNIVVWAYQRPGLNLHREREEQWKIVPMIPMQYRASDPFNWCLGSDAGRIHEKYLDSVLVERAVCVAGREVRAGFYSYWGLPHPTAQTIGMALVFDKHSHLPLTIERDFYPNWHPKDFAKLPHTLQTKVAITWQEFKCTEGTEKKTYSLPIRVDLVTTGNGYTPKNVELTNRIRWLLNDDVPDALFEDPSKQVVVLPTFPDYPADQK